MIHGLPGAARFVLADEGYDDRELYELVERRDGDGHLRRRLVVPTKMGSLGRNSPPERRRRVEFANSTRGRKLYSRRMPSVERLWSRIIDTFDARKVWFKGMHYNCPFLLLLVLGYQALVCFNFVQGSDDLESIKPWIQCI